MIKAIAATALSAVMAITSVAQVQAFPMPPIGQASQIEKVQYSNGGGTRIGPCAGSDTYADRNGRCHYRSDMRRDGGDWGRDRSGWDRNRNDRDRYRAESDRDRYWHGHRGYRDYRPGYRRNDDGWWYPLAAFGLGAAIIGGMAAQQAPRPQVGVAMPVNHVRWCQARYRSYDPYSDTFQPNRGPRQRCISPY